LRQIQRLKIVGPQKLAVGNGDRGFAPEDKR
jgi:hypothetical protein